MEEKELSYKLSVDVGGTFTDIVVYDDAEKKTYTTKVSSTPSDYSIGIEEGIKKISRVYGLPVENMDYFIHGTTVATNTLLERKGAKTALVTTKGFRDVLEIGRQKRPDLYNFWVKRPQPPIPRYLVFEIDERTLADGTVLKSVERGDAEAVIEQLKRFGVVRGDLLRKLLHQRRKRTEDEGNRAGADARYPSVHIRGDPAGD